MQAFLVTLWAAILRLCGWAAPAPAFAHPPADVVQNEAPRLA